MGISWLTLLVAFVSQVMVALVAVRLALGRFRDEKWWERKYEAYSQMLTSLHRLRKSYSTEAEITLRDREPTPEQKLEWAADYKSGSDDLTRHADLGNFLISQEAVDLIHRFGRETQEASKGGISFQEYLEGNLRATDRFLDDLKRVAKQDLGAQPLWRRMTTLISRRRCLL